MRSTRIGLWLYLESWSQAPRSRPPVRVISRGLRTGTKFSLGAQRPALGLVGLALEVEAETVRVQTRRSPRLSESHFAVLVLAPRRM